MASPVARVGWFSWARSETRPSAALSVIADVGASTGCAETPEAPTIYA